MSAGPPPFPARGRRRRARRRGRGRRSGCAAGRAPRAAGWAWPIDSGSAPPPAAAATASDACHRAHNVPAIPDAAARGEVDLEGAVRARLRRRGAATPHGGPARPAGAGPLQPLRQPAVRAGLPDAGHLEARRRHRDDRRAPLHRLPVLRGGVPVRLAQLQLGRPAAARGRRRQATTRRAPAAWWRSARSARSGSRRGRPPACVEACPERAMDLRRPRRSRLGPAARARAIATPIRRKPELGTRPQIYYLI